MPLTAIFIDLNNFKRINDTYSHQEGDRVLRDMAGIIRRNSRSYDIGARIGGDEFIILLPATSWDEALAQISRLDRAFSDYSRRYGEQQFSVSFGVADSKEESDFAALMKRADQRLYQNKRDRKGRPGMVNFPEK